MKVLTADAQPALKLALHTTTPNEWSEAPDYAYLEVTPAHARALLHVIWETRELRRRLSSSGHIEPGYGILLGLGERLPRFELISIPFDEAQEPDRDRPVVELPESYEPASAVDEHRVECHRVEVGCDWVRFTALLRRGDDRFLTTDLSETLLQAIANEFPSGLPAANLMGPQAAA
jgi:hypothetical protein